MLIPNKETLQDLTSDSFAFPPFLSEEMKPFQMEENERRELYGACMLSRNLNRKGRKDQIHNSQTHNQTKQNSLSNRSLKVPKRMKKTLLVNEVSSPMHQSESNHLNSEKGSSLLITKFMPQHELKLKTKLLNIKCNPTRTAKYTNLLD